MFYHHSYSGRAIPHIIKSVIASLNSTNSQKRKSLCCWNQFFPRVWVITQLILSLGGEKKGGWYQTSNLQNLYQKKLSSDDTCKFRCRRCGREKAATGQQVNKESLYLIVATYHLPSYYWNTVLRTKNILLQQVK